ncbi:MAG: hypothetical protein IT313_11105 [Anaerolineales bacterium]|nr:hypothetical protein [Anaerolineales bacterium]
MKPFPHNVNKKVGMHVYVWWGITVLLATAIGTGSVGATHYSGEIHQKLVHQGAGSINVYNSNHDEDWCPESHTTYMYPSTLGSLVSGALLNTSPRWKNVSNGLVDYYKTFYPCGDYADTDWIEIEYHVSKTNSENPEKWCSEDYSCVTHYGSVWSGTHSHYFWQWVNLDYDNIKGSTSANRRTINHETGHVYGLLDGDGTCSPTSIMHNIWYGCSYSGSAPTSSDLQAVLNVGNIP